MVDSNTSCAKWRRFLTVTSLLIVCEAWAAVGGVTVTAIGYDTVSPSPPMAWVDNEQLLFGGKKSNIDPKKRSFAPAKVYLWNDQSKSVREYADAESFCYADGWISYGKGERDEAGNWIGYRGPFGKEERIKIPPGKLAVYQVYSPFSCKSKSIDAFAPPLPKDREYLVLREGDGFLSLKPTGIKGEFWQHPRNITLFREKGATPVTLPITWDEGVDLTNVEYSEYLKAYLIRPSKFLSTKYASRIRGEKGPGPWPKGEPRVVYKLDARTGSVDRLVVPSGFGGWPIRHGWIYDGGDVYKVGSVGLYVINDGKPKQVDAGVMNRVVVSPDGCRLAVAINNWYLKQDSSPTTIKIINLCGEVK